ncbi:DUF4232 domain-containing protein [Streptomyces sp. NPDC006512]|uniref:DUF4232 domain-containing protein n=1 Tax=Streptomyces sp. NPDC006512 TaxID=3154307 RepID=UPI0033B82D7E
MRTTQKTWKTFALGGVAFAALLSSTACGPADKGDGAGGATPAGTPGASASAGPVSPGATPPAAPGASASAGPTSAGSPSAEPTKPAATSPKTTATAKPGASGSPGGDGKTALASCTDANVSITTTYYRMDSTKHVLLTATNTGDKPCTLYRYPSVRFDGAPDQIGPLESDWHAVATIRPREKAYAGVRLYRVGEELRVVTSMTVAFRNSDNSSDAGKPVKVSLADQGGGLNVDAGVGVTYWNTDVKVVEKYLLAT